MFHTFTFVHVLTQILTYEMKWAHKLQSLYNCMLIIEVENWDEQPTVRLRLKMLKSKKNFKLAKRLRFFDFFIFVILF